MKKIKKTSSERRTVKKSSPKSAERADQQRAAELIPPSAAPAKPHARPNEGVRGNMDRADAFLASGWAADFGRLEERLEVEILDGERLIAAGTADIHRPDLETAGIGDGRHCFRISLPASVADGEEHMISARVAGSEVLLGRARVKASA